MTEHSGIDQRSLDKAAALVQKRKDILSASPEKALETLISSDLPASLVQSFSEQDLYFLCHTIGIADAIPVLAMATSEQWGYMLDMEVWSRDLLNMDSVTRWFRALLLADGRRLVRWLLVERLEFIELYLFRNIDVIVREENQDPSEIPDEYFTVDDYFYVRVKEKPEILPERGDDDMITQEDLDLVIRELLEKILELDHGLYQNVMLESMGVVPAEVEEDVFRLRNVRLAEHGFLPFDESAEVFSPVTLDNIKSMSVSRKIQGVDVNDPLKFPLVHLSGIHGTSHFSQAIAHVDGLFDRGEFEMEFAALCNQIITAEQNMIREKETLAKIVNKASSYVSLGLEIIQGPKKEDDNNFGFLCASLIKQYSLKNLFRLGYGRILELKHMAERLSRDSWFSREKLPLSFWGENYLGILGGLLVKRPVFYDPGASGSLYREFEKRDDLERTENILSDIRIFDDLLSLVMPRIDRFKGFFITYDNVLLTLWAHRQAGHGEHNEGPVSLTDFIFFFNRLWVSGERSVTRPGVICETAKTDFLQFLSTRSGLKDVEISQRLGRVLEKIFNDIEKEYGAVREKDLDPRYITHFCVTK